MRQRQLREHLLQPGILGLEFLEPQQLRDVEAPVIGLPVVKGRLGSPVGKLYPQVVLIVRGLHVG